MTAPEAAGSSLPSGSRWEFEAIGTRWQVDTDVELSASVRSEVGAEIEAFDRAWSRFRPDAEIAALATAGGSIPVPVDAAPMLELYLALSAATAEAVNPLIGDALTRRGYDAHYGLVDRGAQPAPAGWSQLLTWNDDRLTLRTPATIDIGGAGQGAPRRPGPGSRRHPRQRRGDGRCGRRHRPPRQRDDRARAPVRPHPRDRGVASDGRRPLRLGDPAESLAGSGRRRTAPRPWTHVPASRCARSRPRGPWPPTR